ncbi:MAG: DUF3370 domain-containing protein [Synechococcales bacterium]|nr:DUF3370 domain-containing protein [Synechococcales bacterium]
MPTRNLLPHHFAPLALLTLMGTGIATTALQTTANPPIKPTPQEILQPGEIRPLPGKLDGMRLFNSNSPEWIKTSGILLSTFPTQGKTTPAAHLNFPLTGEFNLFAHHFTHTPKDLRTLYIGILVHNPGKQPVAIAIPAAASYQLEEAPFKNHPMLLENPKGEIFSGPGIRAVDTVLRGQRQPIFPDRLVIPPGEYRMLLNHPIPTKGLARPVNGRSTFMRLRSSGNVYLASLALFAPLNPQGQERSPTLQDWRSLLETGHFAGPRDKTPTPLEATSGPLIYSRVAGIQQGANWVTPITDPGQRTLGLPAPGRSIAYPLSTLHRGRLGTHQSQAGKLLVRYGDTAYEAHGNYATYYDLTLPLQNRTPQPQTVTITLATPLKEENLSKGVLRFRQPSLDFPYFRGTVRLRYNNDLGKPLTRYLHLWHRTGQVVEPLVKLNLKPQEQRSVRLDFYYPPDATPPQALIVQTGDR